MPLKVFCTGYGRTGTNSMKTALEILGYPCFHMVDIVRSGKDVQIWMDAYAGKKVDWDAYLEGYEAACDWPAITFYRELIDQYPEAKIVHSVRDGEKWWQSARNTIYEISLFLDNTVSFPFSLLLPKRIKKQQDMVQKLVWQGEFEGRFLDKEFAIRKMEEHTQKVLDYKGKENVLIFRVQDGWEPLCAFLGVPVPDVPFPHTNDTNEFRNIISKFKTSNAIINGVFWTSVAAGVAAIAVQAAKRYHRL